jgi:hypothetical protein
LAGLIPFASVSTTALALACGDEAVWFWIGTHADYDDIIKSL